MNSKALWRALIMFFLTAASSSLFLFLVSGLFRIIAAIGITLFATYTAVEEYKQRIKERE